MGDKLCSTEGAENDDIANVIKGCHSPNGHGHLDGLYFGQLFYTQKFLEKMDRKLDIVLQRLRDNTDKDTASEIEFAVDANEKERPLVHASVMRQDSLHRPKLPKLAQRDVLFLLPAEGEEALPLNRSAQSGPPTPPPSAPSTARNILPRTFSGLSKHSCSTSKSNKTSGSSQVSKNTSHLSPFATEFLSSWSKATSSRSKLLDAVHFTLDDPESSRVAFFFHLGMPILIGISIAIAFAQSIELEKAPIDNVTLRGIDIWFNAVFFVEVCTRFMVYPARRNLLTRMSVGTFFFVIDVATAIPFGIFVICGAWSAPEYESGTYSFSRYLLLCLVPQLRLLKMLRYMEKFHLLSHAFILILEALPSMVYVIMVMIWFFASLIVVFEPPENVNSLAHAMWLAILTMSTVGYGDVTPITVPGYVVVSALVICSIMYTAMAFGLIGNIFTSVWKDRDRILLSRKMCLRLDQWGYKPHQIPQLFKKFDNAGKGELDVFTFREMIGAMRLCLTEDRINALFLQFDIDGGGTIDACEFIRHLFPKAFHELYGARLQEEELLVRSNSGNNLGPQPKVASTEVGPTNAANKSTMDVMAMVHSSSVDSAVLAKLPAERSQSHKLLRSFSRDTKASHPASPLGLHSPVLRTPQGVRSPHSPSAPS